MDTGTAGARWSRRQALWGLGAVALAPAWATKPAAPLVEVWKSPSCGCCGDWIAHLQAKGFTVKAYDSNDMPAVRARWGVADRYASCHTARVEGYSIEGHVPAREIRRLLHERPDAVGLSVPGMPIGSPGMDGPVYQGRRDPYEVLLLSRRGGSLVYARYPS